MFSLFSLQSNDIEDARRKITDSILVIATMVGSIGIITSTVRVFDLGFTIDIVSDFAVFSMLCFLTFFRKHIPFFIKALFIIIACVVMAILGIFSFGLSGQGYMYLLCASVFCLLFFGNRASFLFTLTMVVYLYLFAFAVKQQIIDFDLDLVKYTNNFYNWINYTTGYALFSALLIAALGRFHNVLISYNDRLKTKTDALEDSNMKLYNEIRNRLRAEQQIEQNEKKLFIILENIPVAVALCNTEGQIINSNHQFTQLFGIQQGLVNTIDEWANIVFPEESYRIHALHTIKQCITNLMESSSIRPHQTYKIQTPENELKYIDMRLSSYDDIIIFAFTDLTERIRNQAEILEKNAELATTEEELRFSNESLQASNKQLADKNKELFLTMRKLEENENKFRTIFNVSPIDIIITDPYDNDSLVDVNKSFLSKIGLPKDQVVGRTFEQLGIHIRNHEKYKNMVARLHKRGWYENEEIELSTDKMGDMCIISSGKLFKITSKSYLISASIDITLRKKEEEELNMYRTSLEEQVDLRTNEINQLNEELSEALEVLFRRKEDLQKTLDKLQTTQSQLVQSEKMASLGVLTAGIAHEINNPINYINSGVEGMEELYKDFTQLLKLYNELTVDNFAKKLHEINDFKDEIAYDQMIGGIARLLQNVRNGVDRTAQIVRSLRMFTRLDEDDLKAINLYDNIDSTLIMLQHRYKNSIEIVTHFETLPLIQCYAGQINQVLMNIFSNALDAIDGKGVITIKTKYLDAQRSIELSITDTGCGISEHDKSRIFEPFFTTKDVGKGTGLGLSISYNIVQKHHGTIEVFSTIGHGAEFVITLPIDQKERKIESNS